MELITRDMPPSFRLAFAGDFHFGNSAWHSKGVEQLISRVSKKKDLYLVLMGDLMENVTVDHPHFCADVHDGELVPLRQAEELIDMLRPIRGKIITTLEGNHEYRYRRVGNFAKYIADKLMVPYGGNSAKINLTNSGQSMFKTYITHGWATFNSVADDPVRRRANMELALKRKLQHLAGDTAAMVCAHSHKILVCQPSAELFLTDDGAAIQAHYTSGVQHGQWISPELRWYINSGSYLRSHVVGKVTYSERGMMAPSMLGHAEMIVKGGQIIDVLEYHAGVD